jgi:hypothetical protein
MSNFITDLKQYIKTVFLNKYFILEIDKRKLIESQFNYFLSNDHSSNEFNYLICQGCKYDILNFIDHHFSSLSLGLKLHFFHDVLSLYKKWKSKQHLNTMKKSADSEISDKESDSSISEKPSDHLKAYQLLLKWKSGKLSPLQIFNDIRNLVNFNQISYQLGESIINFILSESGYENNISLRQYYNKSERTKFEISNIDLFSVIKFKSFVDSNAKDVRTELFALHGKYLSIDYRSNDVALQVYPQSLQPLSHQNHLWWQYLGEGDQLLFVPSFQNQYTSDGGNFHADKSILIIGQQLKLKDGNTMDVESVLGCDSLSHSQWSNGDMIHVCILISGRLSTANSLDSSSRGYEDGSSDYGEIEHKLDGTTSGSGRIAPRIEI